MSEVKDYGNGYNSNNSIAIVWAIDDVEYRLDEYYPKLNTPTTTVWIFYAILQMTMTLNVV